MPLKRFSLRPVLGTSRGREKLSQAVVLFPERLLIPARLEVHKMRYRSPMIARIERDRVRYKKSFAFLVALWVALLTVDFEYIVDAIVRGW